MKRLESIKRIGPTIKLPENKTLEIINDFLNIKEKEVLEIIEQQSVDVDEIYYFDYLQDEPITDGDWKYALKTAIISSIGEFENCLILKIN